MYTGTSGINAEIQAPGSQREIPRKPKGAAKTVTMMPRAASSKTPPNMGTNPSPIP